MNQENETPQSTIMSIELLRRIPRGRKITALELHEQLKNIGINRTIRTIQRQLDTLSQHFEIERDEQSRPYGYRWKEFAQGLSLPYLSEQESLLLQLAHLQLKLLLPAAMMQSLNGLFEQAQLNLKFKGDALLAQQWLKKVRVVSTTQPLLPPQIQPQVLEETSNALYNNQWLQVTYRNAKGHTIDAKIMPLGLAQQGVMMYLICRFEGHKNERSLALHRFISARKLTLTFEYPSNFDLENYDKDGRFGLGNGQPIKLAFKIKKPAGLHIVEAPLSQDQKVTDDGDYYLIEATLIDSYFLDRWLLGFGSEVKQIEKTQI